ncbi:FAD-dependent oxidoreductase [Desulfatitalea alkaliphila]|nr:FAD-dependent oxidoreductase [Desulfatitalea alkaliphila]
MERLKHLPTLRIAARQPITLRFNGRTLAGCAGDTVATLLYGSGERIFGRSLKYHRPRGLYSLDGECSNAMMTIDGMPNLNAELTPAREGMRVEPQNVMGSLKWDLLGGLDHLAFAMPAGFFYKTLHKPSWLWPRAVKGIRRAAGLGVLHPEARFDQRCDAIYPNVDVCVVGGGPAGLSAALAAAEEGLRVALLEARPRLGGFCDYRVRADAQGKPLHQWAAALADQVRARDNIRVFTDAPVVGAYPDGRVAAFQRGGPEDAFDLRYIEITAAGAVVATGCIERPLLFAHNDRPGVMQMGCAHRLLHTYGIRPAADAVFSVAHDLGLEAAIDLHDQGVTVHCVADARTDGQDPLLIAALEQRGIPLRRGWVAHTAHGRSRLRAVTLGTPAGTFRQRIACELLVASAGLTPLTGLVTMAGGQVKYDPRTGFFLPVRLPPNMQACGRLRGLHDPAALAADGTLAGLRAAEGLGCRPQRKIAAAEAALAAAPGAPRGSKWLAAPGKGAKTFICFDEDGTLKHLHQAMAQGFDVPELIKRFTAIGTGPGQGGIPGHNLPLLVAAGQASPASDPMPTTVRPPLVAAPIAAYAGGRHDMAKRTPMHDAQVAAGGRMERVGEWFRARRFGTDPGAAAEIMAVRTNVGLLDASTLGKFRVFGPDALKALQRVYVGDMARTRPFRTTYAAMCNEDGCVIDDGVVIRTGDNDFYITTSTGRAAQTVEWFRYHTRYDGWDYHIVNLTDAHGVINIAGPNARKVLEAMTADDVANTAFPFAACRDLTLAGGIPARAMRLGFVGELSYELHVPASCMETAWRMAEAAGAPFGIAPFGLEAQNTLRMEKGHVILGSESEQRTVLHDLGLGFLWCRTKPEAKTVGALALRDTADQPGRLKLVGFKMETPGDGPPRDGSPVVNGRIRGYVCTARHSHALGEPVGMALVEEELARGGTRLGIYEDGCGGRLRYGTVAPMPFYDPEGTRMRI